MEDRLTTWQPFGITKLHLRLTKGLRGLSSQTGGLFLSSNVTLKRIPVRSLGTETPRAGGD